MNTTTTIKLGLTGLLAIGLAACASPATPAPTSISNTEVATTSFDTATPEAVGTEDLTGTAMMASTEMPATPVSGTDAPSGTATPLTSITIATDTTLGAYLADGNGRPLYIFANDTGTTSTCDTTCQQEWQPVIVNGVPALMTGVSTSLIGTSVMANGQTQLTIGGHPVYYHVSDTMSGELSGQGMGNAWFLISPTGAAAH